jgi:hypothetical protein
MSRYDATFPLCPHRHPLGARYHMQHFVESEPEYALDPARPRPLLCPWCDWERLRVATARPKKCATATASDAGREGKEA